MARTSIIDPIILQVVRDAGKNGATIAEMAVAVDNETDGSRGIRGVETQARKLVEMGKLARKYRYFYPVMEDGTQMKSPVRRYRYLLPELAFFFDNTVIDPS